jgi:hypothetical protein
MNWTEVLLAGLGGGVGGGLAGLLAALFKGKVRKDLLSGLQVALVVVLGGVGAQLGKSQRVRDWFSPPTRLEVAIRKCEPRMMASAALRAHLGKQTAQGSHQAGAELSHAGLKRLPTADLRRWNTLRLALASSSAEVCTALWKGKADPKAMVAVIEDLPEKDIDDWARISTDAMILEAEAAPAPVDTEGFTKGLRALLQALPADQATRLQAAFGAGTGLAAGESCWAVRVVMQGAESLQPTERDLLLRGLAGL